MEKNLTVLIPVFNTKPAALMEAVYSILNQNYEEPFKVIIIDDASTDPNTISVLQCLKKTKVENREVQIIKMPKNGGTSAALNAGHFEVDTEFVAIMGSDDISDRNRFAAQMGVLKANPKIDVCGTDLYSFRDVDPTRKSIWQSNHPKEPTLNNTSNGWLVNHGTVIYRQKSVMDVAGYDVTIRRGQDVDLWKRMAADGKKFFNIKQVYYLWRKYQ